MAAHARDPMTEGFGVLMDPVQTALRAGRAR
jgi:hypothetical protein